MTEFEIEPNTPNDDFFGDNRTASELVALLIADFRCEASTVVPELQRLRWL